ncbi:MAG: hypothetical protein O6762_02340 [Thaumarchaeota archaeon]|nr:hypothetical protein [Nitrososphaerota archaeon]
MPEIWLPYGDVDVPLDIRTENLGELVENGTTALDHDQLLGRINDLRINQEVKFVLPELTANIMSILQLILEKEDESRKIEIFCRQDDLEPLKKIFDSKGHHVLSLGSSALDLSSRNQEASTILLTEVGFNPVYGFSGGPLSLSVAMSGDQKVESAVKKELPTPGDEPPENIWTGSINSLDEIVGVEVLPTGAGIQDVFVGDPIDTHRRAMADYKKKHSYVIHEPARALLVSPGRGADRTLHSSLTAIWNSMQSIREGGTICLVAECLDGLGSEALRLLAEGRLKGERSIKESVRDREDVLFLSRAISRYNLILISTIPLHYSREKLGFKIAKGVGDGLEQILEKHGSRTKITVVPDASRTLLKSRKE